MLLPQRLAIFYPLATNVSGPIPPRQLAVSIALLLALTLVAVWARRQPWLLIGWFWYLGTLFPAIGLIQVGSQAHADRYTYFPLVGIFVALAWLGRWLMQRWRALRGLVVIVAV